MSTVEATAAHIDPEKETISISAQGQSITLGFGWALALARTIISGFSRMNDPRFKVGSVSDGYHTFDELYAHRLELFLALCRIHFTFNQRAQGPDEEIEIWCSKLHSDGTMFDGWFVAGIHTEPGKQITYHLPIDYWPEALNWCKARDRAPEWDGHTPADVLERLKSL